ncbi:hypothetical protein HY989_01920 [Candidatus Micrarchaeota archaeon]|nr:hypothetical protein [Candidatus Micrarchaeota archaeon]
MAQELFSRGGKEWIIWASCIDEPRNLKQIMEKWEYKTEAGALYRSDLVNSLIKSRAIRVVRVENKANFYEAETKMINKGFLNKVLDEGDPTQGEHYSESIFSNQKEYLEFINKDYVRKTIYSLDRLKAFYNSDPWLLKSFPEYLFYLPFITCTYFKSPKITREVVKFIAQEMYKSSPTKIYDYLATFDKQQEQELLAIFPSFLIAKGQKGSEETLKELRSKLAD